MNAPSEDFATILDGESSVSLTLGIDLFVSEMPDQPDLCAGVYDSGGFSPEYDYVYERPTVQVRVRGDAGQYRDAYALARAIRDALSPLANQTVGSTRYVAIWATGDLNFVGYDERQRPLITLNFRAHRTE